jgi:hypothetical protein
VATPQSFAIFWKEHAVAVFSGNVVSHSAVAISLGD